MTLSHHHLAIVAWGEKVEEVEEEAEEAEEAEEVAVTPWWKNWSRKSCASLPEGRVPVDFALSPDS